MDVTLFGTVIEASPEHSLKASFPIDFTLFGIVMEDRPVQPLKAFSPMVVTLSEIETFLIVVIPLKTELIFSQSNVTSSISLFRNMSRPIVVGAH
jgi:hypothetical protein